MPEYAIRKGAIKMLTFNQKAHNFTTLVNKAAADLGCIFCMDSGEGREHFTDTLYCEDISGWLVPIDISSDFLAAKDKHDTRWDEFFRFAQWRISDDNILIDFIKYPIYHDAKSPPMRNTKQLVTSV